ncbi:MAG: PEPxxWA-CTERM sorting domain-containing protein [Sphingomonadaceae bacterium]
MGQGYPAIAADFVFTGARQNVNPITPPGTGRCAPTYFNTVSIGPGAISSTGTSNFGDFTATQSHCITSAPPTSVVDGIFSYDFAAGDSLFGAYTGSVTATGTPGLFNTIENLVVTGGTGRFLNASGTINTSGQLQFGMLDGKTVGNYSGKVEGLLSLPAVPEPATWMLLIMGFGAVGGALRSKKSTTPKMTLP